MRGFSFFGGNWTVRTVLTGAMVSTQQVMHSSSGEYIGVPCGQRPFLKLSCHLWACGDNLKSGVGRISAQTAIHSGSGASGQSLLVREAQSDSPFTTVEWEDCCSLFWAPWVFWHSS